MTGDPARRQALHARIRAHPNHQRKATWGWLRLRVLRPLLWAMLILDLAAIAAITWQLATR